MRKSIRFGSTVTGSNGLPYLGNEWSTKTENGSQGDPILIIRNGQHEDNQESWKPILIFLPFLMIGVKSDVRSLQY